MTFKSQKNPAKIYGISAVLQFVLPRFILSKKFRSYLTTDWKTKAASVNITFLKFPSLTNLV